jgi:hypothetical protein
MLPTDGAAFFSPAVTFRWGSTSGASQYDLQVSTSATFAPLAYRDSAIVDTSRLVNLQNNASYFWRVRAKFGDSFGVYSAVRSFRVGPAYPATYALNTSVTFPTYPLASDYSPTEYRLVGLPGAGSIPVQDILTGSAGTDWQVYWDNGAPSQSAGLIPYNGGADFVYSTGRAFWVIRKGDLSISRNVPTAALDTSGSVLVPLHSGWNLITNPYIDSIPWPAVRTANGLGVAEVLYGFNGSFSNEASLLAYTGYYYFNSGNLQALRFPFADAGTVGKIAVTAKVASGEGEGWTVTVELSSGSSVDRTLWFGVTPGADRNLDPMDQRKPRTVGPIAQLAFSRPAWDAEYSTFASDIRGEGGEAEQWDFEAFVPSREEARLQFDGLDQVPATLSVALADRQLARVVDLRATGGAYTFTPPLVRSEFVVLVGSENAIRDAVSGMAPREFALGDNYPNPFNPSTTIPVSIPANSEVALKVYNLLGEEVATLHEGSLAAGRYYFVWDGRNLEGSTVPTGLYLSRLTVAGGSSYTKKMLLVK